MHAARVAKHQDQQGLGVSELKESLKEADAAIARLQRQQVRGSINRHKETAADITFLLFIDFLVGNADGGADGGAREPARRSRVAANDAPADCKGASAGRGQAWSGRGGASVCSMYFRHASYDRANHTASIAVRALSTFIGVASRFSFGRRSEIFESSRRNSRPSCTTPLQWLQATGQARPWRSGVSCQPVRSHDHFV
eukprot:SAG31_NODE_1183_length_9510_cov_43.257040_4_plen_198_part_00